MALKSTRIVQKVATPGARVLSAMLPSRGTGWPGGWSANRTEQVMHWRNWNYVSGHVICSKIGSLVPNIAYVHRERIPGKTRKYGETWTVDYGGTRDVSFMGQTTVTQGFYGRKALGNIVKPHEDLEPLEYDHPLRRLIDNPNQLDTSYDLFYELQMFLELCGVAYLWVVPNTWGVPCELWVIPSHWVWPRTGMGLGYWNPADHQSDALISYYEVRPWGGLGAAGQLMFPANEVIMFRNKSPWNKLDGYGAQQAGDMWIDTDESITKSRWAQMINQARPELWVKVPADISDPDDPRLDRIGAKFMAKYSGELNVARPLFTSAGMEVQPLSFSPQEMEYFQSGEQSRDTVLALRQFPKTAAGISNDMTFGSVLATIANLCSMCINPRLIPLGLTLTKHLCPRFSSNGAQAIRLWYDDCSPADPQQVNSDIAADQAAYAISPNEVRALRGKPAWKHGGDDPMVPGAGGVVPLPLNTGRDLTGLADLVPVIPHESVTDNADVPDAPEAPEAEHASPDDPQAPVPAGGKPGLSAPRVESPNGKPGKGRKDLMPGGLGDDVDLSDYDPEQVRQGMEVEAEHTPDEALRREIVADHLAEDPRYYDKLRRAEGKGKALRLSYEEWLEVQHAEKEQRKKAEGDVVKDSCRAAGLALLAEDTGRVLMLQRALEDGDENGGKWEFPGGKRYEGEFSPFDTARREWAEETGLDLPPDARSYSGWESRDGVYRGYVFTVPTEASVDLLSRDLTRNPDGDHFVALAWIGPEDFYNHNLRPKLLQDADLVRQALGKQLRGAVRKGWLGVEMKGAIRGVRWSTEEKAAKDAVLEALRRLGGSHVDLVDLRAAVPLGRAEFDAAVNQLRREGVATGAAYEGRHGITPQQAAAQIVEPGNRPHDPGNVGYLSLRRKGKKDAPEIDKGVLSTVQSAGQWLADKWRALEGRYGRAGALAVAISSLVTFPLPGNITAIVAVAEGIRKLTAKAAPKPKKARPRNRLKGILRKATPSTNGKH